MNNRRGFFKSLGLIAAGAVGCPGIFIPKFEPVVWKPERKVILWTRAEYRCYIYPVTGVYEQVILHTAANGDPCVITHHTYDLSGAMNPEFGTHACNLGEWKLVEPADKDTLKRCV